MTTSNDGDDEDDVFSSQPPQLATSKKMKVNVMANI